MPRQAELSSNDERSGNPSRLAALVLLVAASSGTGWVAVKDRSALIIEDNSELAVIFSQALQAAGFATGIIRDGGQAIAWLRVTKPDVVVLDLHLPNVSGTEILRQIRADARLAGTRVIVATADSRVNEALRDQADLVLIKPVSFRQLRDLAERLVSSTEEPADVR